MVNPGNEKTLVDTGERILPAASGEISYVFARHKFAYEYIGSLVADQSVLDVGCGTGYGSHILSQKAARVVGIDHDAGAIAYCRTQYASPRLEFRQMDATMLDFEIRFDAIVCLQVIEHFHNVDGFIDLLRKHTRPGGIVYLSTPNISPVARRRTGNLFHHHEMTHAEFTSVLRKRFEHVEICGVAYARANRLRTVLGRMPFYQWGRFISRRSPIKKVAARVLDLMQFQIIRERVAERAVDLLAICRNE